MPSSFSSIKLTKESMPSIVLKSQGRAIHSILYFSDNSLAFSIRAGAFLAVIYTFAPFAKKPAVIISPIPLDPPDISFEKNAAIL